MFRQQISATNNDLVVCMVSRLVKENRPDIFANVVRRLYARGVPFREQSEKTVVIDQYYSDQSILQHIRSRRRLY